MDDCCCSGETRSAGAECSGCGGVGRPVATTTLKHMVRPELLSQVEKAGFFFCAAAKCDVVYFHPDGDRLRKKDVRVRVGSKETEDPVPICYCFGFTRAMVRDEIERTGACTIPGRISAEVMARHCACEIRNPQGSCCLGNVHAVVKREIRAASGKSSVAVA